VASTPWSITYDNSAPTVAITSNRDPGPTNNASILLTFTFSEVVTGFDATDVTVANATKGTFTATSSTIYTLALTATGTALTANVAANAAADTSGNGNTAATQWSITYDNSAPTVAITSNRGAGPTNNSSILLTFTFSEAVTGFDATDVSVSNATKGTFTATSSTVYTLALTATGTALTANVAANAAADTSGNGNTAAAQWSITYDNSAPTVAITSNRDPGPTNNSAITLTFTFSEGVTGFDATDVAVTNATKGTFTATSSTVYTLAVTPTASAVSASVATNSAVDSASNGNLASTPWSITYDNSAPTVAITSNRGAGPTNNSSILLTFTFSEAVTGFDATDVSVSNATKGTFTASSSTVYTLAITATGSSVTANVAANAANDAAGNGNTAATQWSITYDNSAPTVAITSNRDPGPTNNSSILLTFTFSEAVTGFDASDVSVTNATKGTFTATSSTVYTLAITPTASIISASVAANSAVDLAANGNIASTPWSITYDNAAPTVAITSNRDPGPTNNSSVLLTFTFSEAVTGFDANDVILSNATKGAFTTTSSTVYTLAITPTLSALSASVAANSAIDSASNGNTASTPWSLTYDTTAPSVAITSNRGAGPTNNPSITLTFTFSEAVTGFDATDITVTNATKGAFTASSSTVYTLLLTATGSNLTADVAAYAANDTAGNGNTDATQWGIAYDNSNPTVAITSSPASGPTNNAAMTLTFTFSEAVTGFTASDVILTNATAGTFTATSSTVYTLAITATGSAVSASVSANSAIDSASNGNIASTPWSITYDNSAPTVAITSSPASGPTNNSAITLTFTFSEAVTGFTASDVTLTNATAGTFTAASSTVYTLAITATASSVSASVAGNSAVDLANNSNIASTPWSMAYDNVAPSLTITSASDPGPTNSSAITLTFTFSEAVSGFVSGDISVTNANKGTFTTVSSTVYTLAITATNPAVSASVAANMANDSAGNGNVASSNWSITYNRINLSNQADRVFLRNFAITPIVFANSGAPASSCSVSPSLPSGLSTSVILGTCQISGTPSAAKVLTLYTVTGTAADGATSQATVNITVNNATPPIIPDMTARTLAVGWAASLIFTNTGGAATSCTVSPGLPSGLSVVVYSVTSPASCQITGTSTTALAAATYTITATAADTSTDIAAVQITVAAPSPPNIADATPRTYTRSVAISALSFTNAGSAAVSCSASPALPAGLTVGVSSSTCRISGTPTVAAAAATYTITATAADGSQDPATVQITVNANPPNIADLGARTATVGFTSTFSFVNSGGAAASCTVSPALPSGLGLSVSSNTCVISGNPSASQAATLYTVTASSADGVEQDTATITITTATPNPPILANMGSVTLFTNQSRSLSFPNSGPAVVSCAVSPSLPGGLSVIVGANTCVIRGIPTSTRSATAYTVTATGADGSTGSASVTITVATGGTPTVANVTIGLDISTVFHDIIIMPGAANEFYAQDATGYVYKSTDSGLTWIKQCLAGTGGVMKVSSGADKTVYVNKYVTGVTRVASLAGAACPAFANIGIIYTYGISSNFDVSPNGTLYAFEGASQNYVKKSVDYGQTWTTISQHSAATTWMGFYAVDRWNDGQIQLMNRHFTGTGAGLYRSADYGVTWSLVSSMNGNNLTTKFDPVNQGWVYTNTGYYSSNGGQTWALDATKYVSNTNRWEMAADGAGYVLQQSGNDVLLRKATNMTSPVWSTIYTFPNQTTGRMTVSVVGSTIAVMMNGQAYVSKDSGVSFNQMTLPISELELSGITSAGNNIYGVNPRGTILASNNSGSTWINTGKTASSGNPRIRVSPANVNNVIVWQETYNSTYSSAITFTNDGFTTATSSSNGLSTWAGAVAVSPVNSTLMMFGFNKSRRTTNYGTTWTEKSSSFPNVWYPAHDAHISPVNSNIGWVVERDMWNGTNYLQVFWEHDDSTNTRINRTSALTFTNPAGVDVFHDGLGYRTRIISATGTTNISINDGVSFGLEGDAFASLASCGPRIIKSLPGTTNVAVTGCLGSTSLALTKDGGATWTQVTTTCNMRDVTIHFDGSTYRSYLACSGSAARVVTWP